MGGELGSEDRARIERLLDARQEELIRTRAAIRRSHEGGSELARLDNHPADEGSELHDQEVDQTTELFLEEEERRIAEAREALANGRYGVCRDCRRPIPAERLKVMPEAVRCIDCQRHFEGHHRQRAAL